MTRFLPFLLCSLLLFFRPVFSQNTFYRTFGEVTDGAEGRNVAQAADGGYFLSYYIYHASVFIACVTKLNCAGELEWEKFYDGGSVTLPVDVIPQTDNGCITSFSVCEPSGKWAVYLARLDASGNQVWTRNVHIRAANLTGIVRQLSDGTLFVCGSDTAGPAGIQGTTVARFSVNGQLIWQRHFADGQDHTPLGIAVSPSNRIYVMGYAGFDTLPFTNVFVFALDLNGQFIKRKILSTYYDDEPRSLCADDAGNVYITGRSYFLNTAWDAMFLKLDRNLGVLKSKFIDAGSQQGEWPWFITPAPGHTFVLAGDVGGFNERNPMLIRLDQSGALVWAHQYPVSPLFTNYIFSCGACRDGGFLMTGDIRPASLQRIAPLMKTDSSGNMNCLTSALSVTIRDELMGVLDTALNSYPVAHAVGVQPLPPPPFPITTNSIAFCQQFMPCGEFAIRNDTTCPAACFTFEDQSAHADSWSWSFPGGTPVTYTGQDPPQVCYALSGVHEVSLVLGNPLGTTTYTEWIEAAPDCPVLIPNIFSPNGDGVNDLFQADGIYEPFELDIRSRWGGSVFESDAPGTWWNGESSRGESVPGGIYFYMLRLPESGRRYQGAVQLVR